MKPTQFLQDQFRVALYDLGITVEYYPFLRDSAVVDQLTGEPLDDNLIFGDPIKIQALVDHSPSPHARQAFGLEEPIDIMLEVSKEDTLDRAINFHVGDKIRYGETDYDIQSTKRDRQVSEDHTSYKLACKYHSGRSGDSE